MTRVKRIILSPIKKDKGKLKRTLMKVDKRDLLVNNIPKSLVDDRTQ